MIEGRAFRDEENYVTLVASLTAANARKPAAGSQETAVDVQKIVRTARSLVPAATEARSTRNDVLWVDDHPENNVYERKAFETLGITVSIALSTEQALKLIQSESFGAIISDMGRKEGPKEGYKLLDNLRKQKDKTPFFIYAGSNAQPSTAPKAQQMIPTSFFRWSQRRFWATTPHLTEVDFFDLDSCLAG